MTRATASRSTFWGVVPDGPPGLDAEIVVKAPFVSGRIDLALYVARLESWADALVQCG
ncbi:DUF5959 family protein [Streptomyces rubiginosohelvolus]|uniref:DUF5959 family protein n=1 Tax=Streptomyces rubiginosohelvolus TaxID=67362 RepID=UPI0036CA8BA8